MDAHARIAELGARRARGHAVSAGRRPTRWRRIVTLYALLELRDSGAARAPAAHRAGARRAARRPPRAPGRVPHPDAAAIIYTSGTTGEPRGAVLTRSALLASAQASAANLGWEPTTTAGCCACPSRASAACRSSRAAWRRGAASRWRGIRRRRVPGMDRRAARHARFAGPDDADAACSTRTRTGRAPPHLRAMLLGGAAASPQAAASAPRARRLPIVVTYGLTETCSQVVRHAATQPRFAPAAWRRGHCRSPASSVRMRDGRIEVRGPVLMAGYWNEAAARAGRLVRHRRPRRDRRRAAACTSMRGARISSSPAARTPIRPRSSGHWRPFPVSPRPACSACRTKIWGQTVAAALVAEHGTAVRRGR